MSKDVFVEADSFRRLLLGAAGGYELQGYHEAAEAVMHVVDALDELTTGGKGKSRADEDVEATTAAEVIRLYCEKRRKEGCCGWTEPLSGSSLVTKFIKLTRTAWDSISQLRA